MKIQHQAILAEKDVWIHAMIGKYKDNPQINQFIKEELILNSQLMQRKEVICQKISQKSPDWEISDKLRCQVIDMRLE